MKKFGFVSLAAAVLACPAQAGPRQVSGIYPHLASFNQNNECGIGAVVPWAGRLWWITYPPHATRGSSDKLYSVGPELDLTIHPESVGGTHASRMIHRESGQLIIGPYFIDRGGKVRAADVKERLVGRMTGVARHLTEPESRVYFYDMEGAVYDVDVHTLDVKKLFHKPVPGWHGKGAYTAQGRLVISNNGEHPAFPLKDHVFEAGGPARGPDDAGVLAEWDGSEWRVVSRRQFTDVTGPGDIHGSPSPESPLWAVGWDRRSVILKCLDGGEWHAYRLPKASHSFDPKHGWFTEWPRIRAVSDDLTLMVMHGAMYDFPPGFSAGSTGGIRPVCQHLRYVPDFCGWDGKVVLAADDTSIMQNTLAGQSQSNLWFGTAEDLAGFGTPIGFGGVWLGDAVGAGEISDPFLIAGYSRRVLHLSTATDAEVTFSVEIDPHGRGDWSRTAEVTVPAKGYAYHVFPPDLEAEWLRLTPDRDVRVSAYLHLGGEPRHEPGGADGLFRGLARVGDADESAVATGLLRPAKHNRNLMFLARDGAYFEADETLTIRRIDDARRADEVRSVNAIEPTFRTDAASVIVDTPRGRLRLPKGDAAFDRFAGSRGVREVVSERSLANIHGTFYEVPRAEEVGSHGLDWYRLKPVASHDRLISDYCTWRGLMVLAGCERGAEPGDQVAASDDGVALWFGHIDDLWKFGKPVGVGGPWKDSAVEAGEPSDPYLMTGYDRKRVALSHDADRPVTFRIEVDVYNGRFWKPYREVVVPPGETVEHAFPDGYAAHWVRLAADRDCRATATFVYE